MGSTEKSGSFDGREQLEIIPNSEPTLRAEREATAWEAIARLGSHPLGDVFKLGVPAVGWIPETFEDGTNWTVYTVTCGPWLMKVAWDRQYRAIAYRDIFIVAESPPAIAGHHWVLRSERTYQLMRDTRPPEKTKTVDLTMPKFDDETAWAFSWFSKSWHGKTIPRNVLEGYADEVAFGVYLPDGTTRGELLMRWYWFPETNEIYPQLELSGDAWHLIPKLAPVFAELAADGKISPDQFVETLINLGFQDRTQKHPNTPL